MTNELPGYRGRTRELLESAGATAWSDVELDLADSAALRGIVLPRAETADDAHVVLKLPSGYNVGIATGRIRALRVLGQIPALPEARTAAQPRRDCKPTVMLLGTGGTIASRLDYRTGGVKPAFTPAELFGLVPELAELCNLESDSLFSVFSENMGPDQYVPLAQRIAAEIERGVDGIVIGHGTDTMQHTAAALTFMVQDSPVPIVMVGSQRSADRPSSDAPLNLIHAVKAAAEGEAAEVTICMFGPTSDEYGLLHRGTRARKMHSGYRSAFRTIGDSPLAMITAREIRYLRDDYRRRQRDRRTVKLCTAFESRVALLYYYPNMQPDVIDALLERGYRGIVLAGTGLGHVNRPLYPALARARDAGAHVYMTVQTLWGFSQMYVYETGREIAALGVVSCENMLPETAYVKLCWALGQSDEREAVQRLMLTPINHEITPREPFDGYLIYQGGIPEVQKFLRTIHR